MKFVFLLLGLLGLDSFAYGADYTPTFYGFIKASALVSDQAVESNGRPNMMAYSAAGNPAISPHHSRADQSFQAQQSRFGMKVQSNDNIFGILEFDFVDFSKSSPTVASNLRLRRAVVNFKNDDWTFNVGQDWDLISPLAPYTYNVVGHYFGSGDIGFMRIQAQALKQDGAWEHAAALGFPAYNNTYAVSNPEYSMLPTLALRETYSWDKSAIGISGLVGHIEDQTTEKTITPYVVTVFFKKDWESTNLAAEAYYGHNLENLNLSGLGYSKDLLDLEEYGGFFTLRHKMNDSYGLYGGMGYSRVSNRSNIAPSYTKTGPNARTLNLLNGPSTGYGIAQNGTARLGYEYYWSSKLNLFAETAFLYTEHVLDPTDNHLPSYVHAQVFELGLKLDI